MRAFSFAFSFAYNSIKLGTANHSIRLLRNLVCELTSCDLQRAICNLQTAHSVCRLSTSCSERRALACISRAVRQANDSLPDEA
jgi:hypothetical protein